MDFEQRHSQTSDYEMKFYKGEVANYDMLRFQQQVNNQNKEKYETFKTRLDEFKTVSTLKEAKELAAKILPTKGEQCTFWVGLAKCTVVNNEKVLQISVESEDEFISYNFN